MHIQVDSFLSKLSMLPEWDLFHWTTRCHYRTFIQVWPTRRKSNCNVSVKMFCTSFLLLKLWLSSILLCILCCVIYVNSGLHYRCYSSTVHKICLWKFCTIVKKTIFSVLTLLLVNVLNDGWAYYWSCLFTYTAIG